MSSTPAGSYTPRSCGSIALPVLSNRGDAASPGPDKRTIRKSRMGKWRAGVLIGIHVLFALHLAHWYSSGAADGVRETLSPLEPSESMYALEQGFLNAGFIFFSVAILSTLLFGRYFCGWGCHVVALQDLCGWIMKKCGIHPKPFRSRLLVFVPVFVALYMFVWPTFKREVLYERLIGPERWNTHQLGVWLGETARFPGWSNHLIIEDFWKTFAPWYIAIPFILVCTFGVVYFLGNKGYCTYACPYGGFFGPADLLSIGKIRVNDNCEGCGHCTAVCSSNVRVHEEVRDFGMVVDPGCMKCMDCVSVCPNDALYFGFAKPAMVTGPRTEEIAKRRAATKRRFDLSWREEIFLALVFLLLTQGFRGMLNQVPLLMALGMAGIGTFMTWKLLQVVRAENSRVHSFQLKLKGRLRPAGYVLAPLALLTLSAGAWSATVKFARWRGELMASSLAVPADSLLAPGSRADDVSRRTAERALRWFRASGPLDAGGWGWAFRADELQTIAYLQLVAGRPAETEQSLMEIMRRGSPLDPLVLQLGSILHLLGASDADIAARYREILELQPRLAQVRAVLAGYYVQSGHPDDAASMYEAAVKRLPGDPTVRKDFGMLLAQTGHADRALPLLAEAAGIARGTKGMMVRRSPESLRQVGMAYMVIGRPDLALPVFEECVALPAKQRPSGVRFNYADALFAAGKHSDAIEQMKQVVAAEPRNPQFALALAQMYGSVGRQAEAQHWLQTAQQLQKEQQAAPPRSPR